MRNAKSNGMFYQFNAAPNSENNEHHTNRECWERSKKFREVKQYGNSNRSFHPSTLTVARAPKFNGLLRAHTTKANVYALIGTVSQRQLRPNPSSPPSLNPVPIPSAMHPSLFLNLRRLFRLPLHESTMLCNDQLFLIIFNDS